MSRDVVLKWAFLPPDFFEEPIEISHTDYTMTIEEGLVQVRIEYSVFAKDPHIRQRLHDTLNDRFMGVLLATHRAYELQNSTMTQVHSNGRTDVFIEPDCARIEVRSETLDIQVVDTDGIVI